jgi:outer membrane murein-binding lipoprotein Lpp
MTFLRLLINSTFAAFLVTGLLAGCASFKATSAVAERDAEVEEELPIEQIDSAELDAALARLIKDLETAIEATKSAEEASEKAMLGEDGRYLIKTGDYLDKIIEQTTGDSSIRPSILRSAFVRANPKAFKRSNPNWMLANKRLKVPDVEDIKKVIFKDIGPNKKSSKTIDPYEGWIQYP